MKSIRRRISAWMLPGLAMVWIIGGIGVYRTYRSAIFSAIDSENMAFTRLIRANQRSQERGGGPGRGRANRERPASSDLPAEGIFYQVWNLDGETLAKSDNLGEADLPRPETAVDPMARRTLVLPSRVRVRTVEMTFGAGHFSDSGQGFGPPGHPAGGGGGAMAMVVVVARDLSEADARLNTALIAMVGAGLLMVGGMALLLKLALRDGLQPLDALAAAVSDIDPSSLHARFSTGREPWELKPIVSHLDRLMDRLENGFLRERRFGADLAHELRTPIAEMRTKLDLAAIWPDERNDELFNAAREINSRMQRVVDTMLQLAHLEGQSEGFPIEKVRLAPLVAETWATLRYQAEEKQLRTEIHCPDNATVPGNPNLWTHILANLLSNSVEYTPPGGSICLHAFDDGVSISNTVDEMGIEDVGRMFERFWRADASRSDSHHSGLGLSLVQACAQDMGLLVSASLENRADGQELVIYVRRKSAKQR